MLSICYYHITVEYGLKHGLPNDEKKSAFPLLGGRGMHSHLLPDVSQWFASRKVYVHYATENGKAAS